MSTHGGSSTRDRLSKGLDDRLQLSSEESERLASFTCGLCDQDGLSSNPCPSRHPGNFLKFAHKTQCLPCRNYINCDLKGTPAAKIRLGLKDVEKKAEYNTARNAHAELFEQSKGNIKQGDDRIPKLSWIDSVEEIGVESKKHMPVWWPVSALKRDGIDYEEGDL